MINIGRSVGGVSLRANTIMMSVSEASPIGGAEGAVTGPVESAVPRGRHWPTAIDLFCGVGGLSSACDRLDSAWQLLLTYRRSQPRAIG